MSCEGRGIFGDLSRILRLNLTCSRLLESGVRFEHSGSKVRGSRFEVEGWSTFGESIYAFRFQF